MKKELEREIQKAYMRGYDAGRKRQFNPDSLTPNIRFKMGVKVGKRKAKEEFNKKVKGILEDFEAYHWIEDELDGKPRILIESSLEDWNKLKDKIFGEEKPK